MFTIIKQGLLWFAAALSVVVPTSLLTIYYSEQRAEQQTALTPEPAQPLIPFEAQDAAAVCEAEAQRKFDGQLLRTSIDWHSTRFDNSRNVYLVVLQGAVGTLTNHSEASIYCYVSPRTEEVSYFKTFSSDSKSMVHGGVDMGAILSGFGK